MQVGALHPVDHDGRAGQRQHGAGGAGGEHRGHAAFEPAGPHITDRTPQDTHDLSSFEPGRYCCTFCFTPCLTNPQASSSPCSTAPATPLTCSKVACGGIGGTSGSQITSSTVGRVAASAAVQADPSSSGSSMFTPARPRLRAKPA